MNGNLELVFSQEFITIMLAVSAVIMALTAKIVDILKQTSKAIKILISFFVSALVALFLKLIGIFGTWALLGKILDNLPDAPNLPVTAPNSFYVIIAITGFIMANGLYDLIKNFKKTK